MAADNHTTIVGNLVEDPELRFTNTGIAVANLRVAVTQRIQQDGEWRDGDTSFLRVNVWRGQAEHLADSLAKGDRVMVTGRLRQRSWETPRERSARSPRSRLTRSAPPSSGPSPRSNAPASATTVNAARAGSGRPSGAATSTTVPHSEQPTSAPSAPAGGAFLWRCGCMSKKGRRGVLK
jgi:single-strand DNA-binding protein